MHDGLSEGARRLRALVSPPVTQAELAEKLGVTQQAISSWVTGRTLPTPHRLAELERITGIPMRAWTEPAEDDESGTDAAE
jgi:transcriptional regulator with XRE-family HTH domain